MFARSSNAFGGGGRSFCSKRELPRRHPSPPQQLVQLASCYVRTEGACKCVSVTPTCKSTAVPSLLHAHDDVPARTPRPKLKCDPPSSKAEPSGTKAGTKSMAMTGWDTTRFSAMRSQAEPRFDSSPNRANWYRKLKFDPPSSNEDPSGTQAWFQPEPSQLL